MHEQTAENLLQKETLEAEDLEALRAQINLTKAPSPGGRP